MISLMLWGRHPLYANGEWIKLARGIDNSEYRFRAEEGFQLAYVEKGRHPQHDIALLRVTLADILQWIETGKIDGTGFDEASVCAEIREVLAATAMEAQ